MKASIYCIGERVRDRRRQKNWTQKELAQRAGTTYKYISHVENGYKYPSLEMLICLARELEVTLDYLIGTDQCTGNPAEDIENLIAATIRQQNGSQNRHEVRQPVCAEYGRFPDHHPTAEGKRHRGLLREGKHLDLRRQR